MVDHSVATNGNISIQSTIYSILGRYQQSSFVPLGTAAGFPCRSAEVTKLFPAEAGHMITAHMKLDHSITTRTLRPPGLLAELDKSLIGFIKGWALAGVDDLGGDIELAMGTGPGIANRA